MQHAKPRLHQLEEKDAQLRESRIWPEAIRQLRDAPTSIEVLERACKLYAERPALASREFDVTRRSLPRFHTLSFAAMWERVRALSTGLQKSEWVHSEDLVGMIGFASIDYVIADFACLYLSATSIPLQANYSSEAFRTIINEAGIKTLVCSFENVGMILNLLPSCPTVHYLAIMDFREDDDREVQIYLGLRRELEKAKLKVKVSTVQEMERLGRKSGFIPWVAPAKGADTLVTICYTSGSTGTPKGALFPESLWVKTFKGGWITDEI